MAADEPEDQLVIIAPAPRGTPRPPDRPWVGPLLIIGLPVALAVAVFALFFSR